MRETKRRAGCRLGWWLAVLVGWIGVMNDSDATAADEPQVSVDAAAGVDEAGTAEVDLRIEGPDGSIRPARVVLHREGADEGVDPMGIGLDRDGAFWFDGEIELADLQPGVYELQVRSGFNYLPLESHELNLEADHRHDVRVRLPRWNHPQADGWYNADFHAHAWHGPAQETDIQMRLEDGTPDFDLMALSGRVAGVNLLVENRHHRTTHPEEWLIERERELATENALLHFSSEIRMDPLGHVNVPGAWPGVYHRADWSYPLVFRDIAAQTHDEGGAMVYTHPFWVPYFYWMTAMEMFSDVTLEGPRGDMLDVGRPSWDTSITALFSLWNLGVPMAGAATTDLPLNRGRLFGEMRTYVHSGELDRQAIIDAARAGRTVAVREMMFATIHIGAHGSGDRVEPGTHELQLSAHARDGLESIELIVDGQTVRTFALDGEQHFHASETVELRDGGYVSLIARDGGNGFAIPTAIFAGQPPREDKYYNTVFINDVDRAKETTGDYFFHMIATVNPADRIERVVVYRDGEPWHTLDPAEGEHVGEQTEYPLLSEEPTPEKEMGWRFWPDVDEPQHLVASLPMDASPASYEARIETASGRSIETARIDFDLKDGRSWHGGAMHVTGEQGEFFLEMAGHQETILGRRPLGASDRYVISRTTGPAGEERRHEWSTRDYEHPARIVAPDER